MRPSTILTYADAIDSLKEFMEGQGAAVSQPAIRAAIQGAYEEIVQATDWPFLLRRGRIVTKAPQSTGTITYTHSTRVLLLDGDTWPSWSATASVRIGDMICDVESYTDTTNLVLDEINNPGQDVAAETEYTIYPRYYRLPADFTAFAGPFREGSSFMGTELTLTEMQGQETISDSSGDLRFYAVGADPDTFGYKALYIWPYASEATTIPYTYWHRPRALRFTGHDSECYEGTVEILTSTTIQVSGTNLTNEMTGSIIRFGDTSDVPTGRFGLHPYVEQRSLRTVTPNDAATLDAAATVTGTVLKYRISDPIDLHEEAHNAFLRMAERHLAISRNLPGKKEISERTDMALLDAMGAANTQRWDPQHGAAWSPELGYTVTPG